MTLSSAKPAFHAARDIDEMIAAEWALEDLLAPTGPASVAVADEQDELIEAIALANAEREREAAEERERAITEAYGRGLQDGRREAEESAVSRLRNAVGAAERAIDEARSAAGAGAAIAEENICALACAVARQILHRELRSDADAVPELVRRALTEFPVEQPIRVRIHPDDLALITETHGADGLPPEVAPDREARWMADPQVAQGGCLIEGRERIIDGRVDIALERIYRRLTENHA